MSRLALASTFVLAWLGVACGSSPNGPASTDAAADGGASDADARSTSDGGARRSAGCGASPEQVLAKYIKHTEVISGVSATYAAMYTNRFYWLRLPDNYDPSRAYPTVLIGPGCGESGATPIPIQDASGEEAILVGLNGVNDCFNHDSVDSPDLPYFDATLADVEATACVDTSRVFVTGFSSGAWLTSYLGCARGNLLRGQASVAGGLPPVPACTGPIAAMYVADTDDNKNPPETVKMGVERVRVANGCGTDTAPYDPGVTVTVDGGAASPCVAYQGCMPGYPLVYCETSGLGHADQANTTKLSTVGFWRFWSSLDAR